MLPWWIGVALALGAYLVFHSIATADIETATMPAQVGLSNLGNPWQAFAGYLQYLLPIALLIGALASAIEDERRGASQEPRGPAGNDPAAEPKLD